MARKRSASPAKPKKAKAAKPAAKSAKDIYLTLLQQIPAAQREVLQQALGKGASLGMDDVFAALGVLRVAGAVWALLGPPAPFHELKIFNTVLGLDLEDVELQHALGRGGLLSEAWEGLAPAKRRRCLAFVSVMYAFINEAQLSLILYGELGAATHGGRARIALLQGDLAQAAALLEEMNGTAALRPDPSAAVMRSDRLTPGPYPTMGGSYLRQLAAGTGELSDTAAGLLRDLLGAKAAAKVTFTDSVGMRAVERAEGAGARAMRSPLPMPQGGKGTEAMARALGMDKPSLLRALRAHDWGASADRFLDGWPLADGDRALVRRLLGWPRDTEVENLACELNRHRSLFSGQGRKWNNSTRHASPSRYDLAAARALLERAADLNERMRAAAGARSEAA
mmetsp:Transcript_18870/g.54491  ORF Transcript_18870/g.54491 Transcript_18870/m.54491 type:complete len:396 (+) Transcript_18870:131-1318(+)